MKALAGVLVAAAAGAVAIGAFGSPPPQLQCLPGTETVVGSTASDTQIANAYIIASYAPTDMTREDFGIVLTIAAANTNLNTPSNINPLTGARDVSSLRADIEYILLRVAYLPESNTKSSVANAALVGEIPIESAREGAKIARGVLDALDAIAAAQQSAEGEQSSTCQEWWASTYGIDNIVVVNGFTKPIPNAVVSSRYGWRTHPVTGKLTFHSGTDLAAPCFTPILAAGAGVVTFSDRYGGYGNRIVIDHGNDSWTTYNHLADNSTFVEDGDRVAVGQIIGMVGTTGTSTGCHLHFEARDASGNFEDPQRIFGW